MDSNLEEVAEAMKKVQQKIDDVEAERKKVQQKIDDVEEKIKKVQEKIDDAEEEIEKVEQKIDYAEEEIKKDGPKMVFWQNRCLKLYDQVGKREDQVGKLQDQVGKLQDQLGKLQDQLGKLQDEKGKLQEEKNLLLKQASGSGRALPDTTADRLKELIQPFDFIPESLDVVELRNLLETDLRIKIPCLSYALASSFSDCVQHSTIEECPRLESLLASFLIGPRRPRDSSENALISLWDRLVADLPQLIHEVLNIPISFNRDVVDESLSTCMDKRGYLLYLEALPVVFGEEKRYDNEMSEAVDDLRKKHRGVPGKQIYGRLGYVMCYAAAGQSRFQFFAVPVGIAYPQELIALTRVIDPSLRMGRVELLKTFVNVIRWIYTVHRQESIGGLSLHKFYAPFRRPVPPTICR